jgi:hypothetical protein
MTKCRRQALQEMKAIGYVNGPGHRVEATDRALPVTMAGPRVSSAKARSSRSPALRTENHNI